MAALDTHQFIHNGHQYSAERRATWISSGGRARSSNAAWYVSVDGAAELRLEADPQLAGAELEAEMLRYFASNGTKAE